MLSRYSASTSKNASYRILVGPRWQSFVLFSQIWVALNIFFDICSEPLIILGVSSAITTTWVLGTMFFLLVKVATMMLQGTLRLTFWFPQAALHFVRFPVRIWGAASIKPSRSGCTVIMAWLHRGIHARLVDQNLEETRTLSFRKLNIFVILVTANRCMPYCRMKGAIDASINSTRQVSGRYILQIVLKNHTRIRLGWPVARIKNSLRVLSFLRQKIKLNTTDKT